MQAFRQQGSVFLLLGSLFFLGIVFLQGYWRAAVPPLGGDAREYWDLSSQLMASGRFEYPSFASYYFSFPKEDLYSSGFSDGIIPCTIRFPGYPLALAAARFVWDDPRVAFLICFACYIGICFWGILLGRIFFSSDSCRSVYNALVCFSPLYYLHSGIGVDMLAGFFLAGSVWGVFRLTGSKARWHIVCSAGIFCAAAVLTRGNLSVFVFLLICSLMTAVFSRCSWQALVRLAVVLIMTAVCLWGWMERNKILTGRYLVSTQGGPVLFHVLLSGRQDEESRHWEGQSRAAFFARCAREGRSFNEAEALLDEKLKDIVRHAALKDPALFLNTFQERVRTFFLFSYTDISVVLFSSDDQIPGRILFQISRIYKWLMLVVFLCSPFILWRFRRSMDAGRFVMLLSLCIALTGGIVMTVIFTGAAGDRMRLPFNVFNLIFVVLCLRTIVRFCYSQYRKVYITFLHGSEKLRG